MPEIENSEPAEANPSQWQLPDDRIGETRQTVNSFSILRVTAVVVCVMLVIAPTIYFLDGRGYFESSAGRTALHQGSGQRAAATFELGNASVPRKEILGGGPPKDGIPAISNPKMIAAAEAKYLGPADRVIGVVEGDEARAYPLAILNYHEIVNDRLRDKPIAVSYCPLCDSASVFDRNISTGEREFGVSGLLYNSNVLMYDRVSEGSNTVESLWSQLKHESIAGPQVGNPLKLLPVELTTWAAWQQRHPSTLVMSAKTGHQRDYNRSPYSQYFGTDVLMFPVNKTDDRLRNKEKVLGVINDGQARAYPRSSFDAKHRRVEQEFNGKQIAIEFNPDTETLRVAAAEEGVTWMYSFWFSWYAMHPETDVYDPAVAE